MNSQTSLFDEARARRTDPETSKMAAASVRNFQITHMRIRNLLRDYGPMTDECLVKLLAKFPGKYVSPSGIRTRRSELVAKGLVEYAGYKQVISTGRQARVWRAK